MGYTNDFTSKYEEMLVESACEVAREQAKKEFAIFCEALIEKFGDGILLEDNPSYPHLGTNIQKAVRSHTMSLTSHLTKANQAHKDLQSATTPEGRAKQQSLLALHHGEMKNQIAKHKAAMASVGNRHKETGTGFQKHLDDAYKTNNTHDLHAAIKKAQAEHGQMPEKQARVA